MSLYYAAMSSLHYAASVSGRTIIFRLLRNTTRVERRLRPNTPSAGAGRMPTYSPGCRYLPIDDRTPSPPTSDRSSPANGLLVGGVVYDGCNGSSSFSSHAGVVNGLAVAQQQLKSRSKMHEMAVRQRLITDQVSYYSVRFWLECCLYFRKCSGRYGRFMTPVQLHL
ncbi:hypothetical protein Y032_0109g111 [Ancylostoma ceylanicum]|uniref:Uncharacterized protein n=1 Tax=Ancylostoma ceylanicum TaxID=53326 RepID=A0A016TEW0_9BILA|nr:hypothetical protein Y032_0109g111 [Ancylostoma ceylanicum]